MNERVRITSPANESPTFEMTLQLRECRNTVSGARSAWTAQVVIGPDRLTGCAVPGVR